MQIISTVSAWAKRIKRDSVMLWFARRHPDTPLLAKVICVFAVAYALSPIDLIPDFIPIIGYLDDAILLPAMIWLAVRLLPEQVVIESRIQADAWMMENKLKPKSYAGAIVIALIWILSVVLIWRYYWVS